MKLYQKFTHPETFGEATGRDGARPHQDDVDECRRWLEPVAESGKLGALLAQFPPRFKSVPESRDDLVGLLSAFREYPLAVELRHRSWSDEASATRVLLRDFGAAWVQIDEPKFKFSIR